MRPSSGVGVAELDQGDKSTTCCYVLPSPALFERTRAGGIFRKGVWANKAGDRFTHYDEITKDSQAASDHAAIWADIDV